MAVAYHRTSAQRCRLTAIALLMVSIMAIVLPASGITLSFNDFGISGSQKVTIYNASSQQAWYVGNTTSTGIVLNDTESYLVLFEPETSDLFENPTKAWDNLLAFTSQNFFALIGVGFLLLIVFRR